MKRKKPKLSDWWINKVINFKAKHHIYQYQNQASIKQINTKNLIMKWKPFEKLIRSKTTLGASQPKGIHYRRYKTFVTPKTIVTPANDIHLSL
jgi:hypothetical protein